MNPKTKVIIGVIGLIAIGTASTVQASRGRTTGVEVRAEGVELRDLVQVVTASGNIRARRTVDVSSEVSAKVAQLLIDEGDDVVRGQVLLRLEPDLYQAAVSRNEASLAQAEAQQTQQEANLLQAERDLNRLLRLRARDSLLVSGLQVDDARTRVDIAVAKVRKVLKIAQEPISLETPIGEEEDSHLGDFIEDRNIVSPAEAVINLNLREQTDSVLRSLTPREEKVIKMRFGVGDGSEHTLEEVGQNFAVTRERIRQIEAKALRKLRHPSRSRKLKAFLEGRT